MFMFFYLSNSHFPSLRTIKSFQKTFKLLV
uniref:Uncharacterized protein n=1 Tax=Anguilla anguilla TaxID=7936 RepID=A0A0E9PB12_ANGAN